MITAHYGFMQVLSIQDNKFIMLKVEEDITCDWLSTKAFLTLEDAKKLRDELDMAISKMAAPTNLT